jgi:hypothetical protein
MLQESAARVAGLEKDLRAATDRQITAAAQHEARLSEVVSPLMEQISTLERAVADRRAERDAAYDRLREAKSEKEALIQQLGHILLDVRNRGAGSAHAADLEGLRQEVQALRNSTSWKVTAPLRGVSRLLGRKRR